MAAVARSPLHPLIAINQSLSSLALAVVDAKQKGDGHSAALRNCKSDIRHAAWLYGKSIGTESNALEAEERVNVFFSISKLIGNADSDPALLLERSIEKVLDAAERAIQLLRALHYKAVHEMVDVLMGAGDAKIRAERALKIWNSVPANILQNSAKVLKDATDPKADPVDIRRRIMPMPERLSPPLVRPRYLHKTIVTILHAVGVLIAHSIAKQNVRSRAQDLDIYASIQKGVIQRANQAILDFLSVVPAELIREEFRTEIKRMLDAGTFESSIQAMCLTRDLAQFDKNPKTLALQQAASLILGELKAQARRSFFRMDEIITSQVKVMEILAKPCLVAQDAVGQHLILTALVLEKAARIYFLEVDGIDGQDISEEVNGIKQTIRKAIFLKPLQIRGKMLLRFNHADFSSFIESATKDTLAANQLYDKLRAKWYQKKPFYS